MPYTPQILAFAGSTRRESFNKRLVRIAADAARSAGGEVTLLDLVDYPLPLYDGDLEAEQGLPAAARSIKDLMLAHQGFLIASPEYNSSITAVLKNTIDWASRPAPNETPLACFTDKTAALLSASPGALGGLRGLVHLRSILGNIGTLVLPMQVAVPKANEGFDGDRLKDAKLQANVEKLSAALVTTLRKLHG